MKKEQQIYVLIGFCVLLFVFGYFKFLLSPVNRNIKEKTKKIDKLERDLATAKKESLALDELRMKSELLKVEVKELQKLLPRVKDVPALLRTLTKDAQKFGIKISNFGPQAVIPKQEYNELPYALSFTANFHTLGDFLAEIGQEERLLSVRNVNMSAAGGKEGTTIGVTLTMVAYMAKGG